MEEQSEALPRGVQELRDYLDGHQLTILGFCKQHGLDYSWVYRHLSGERGKRVSVDFAKVIHLATDGKVAWDSWANDTRAVTPDKQAA